MNRYVIMARENWPGAVMREICRCNSNAGDIRNALADYTVTGSQGTRIYKFNHVEILEVSPRKKKEARAQMKKAIRNVDSFSGKPSANQIASVLEQIDAMRAGNGEQAAPQGQATQDRAALSQRKTEAEQP
jgi:hypothetical protein